MLRIKLVKSVIGNTPRNRATVKALGLTKTQQTVEHEDNPVIRGMVHHVKHLLEVQVVDGTPKKSNRPNKHRRTVAAKPTAPRPRAQTPKVVEAKTAEAPAETVEKPVKAEKSAKPAAQKPKTAAKAAPKGSKPKSEEK